MTQDQFLAILNNWIRSNKQTSDGQQLSMDTELFGSGLLDSFDFLDLIVHIEGQTGQKIDLAMADPNEFSVVRGLWNLTTHAGKAQPTATSPRNTVPANAGIAS